MHILLKDLLVEHPQLGGVYLSDDAVTELQKHIHVQINTDQILRGVKTLRVCDGFFYVKGLAGGVYDHWLALFKQTSEGNVLCFACGFKQIHNIEGTPAFQVKFSKKFENFPKKAASRAYLEFGSTFVSGIIITSDDRLTDNGSWIWKELLTRPNVDVFVWNMKERRRETTYDWEDVFGCGDEYANLVVALKTKL